MPVETVNYAAVVTSTIAGMAAGVIWFTPRLFGNAWHRIIGTDPADAARAAKMTKDVRPFFALMFLGVFLSAYMLARLIAWLGWATIAGGMRAGFYIWIGFMLQVVLGFSIFSGRDRRLIMWSILIQGGHYLAVMLLMGAILGGWR